MSLLVYTTTRNQNEVLSALLKEMNIAFEITPDYEQDELSTEELMKIEKGKEQAKLGETTKSSEVYKQMRERAWRLNG